MGPVKVAEDKKEKKDKKGLLASLLSLFGRGASAAGPVATNTATVMTSGAAAGGAGIMGMLLTKNGLITLVVGGGAAAAAVGLVGPSFLGGPPSSTGIKDGAFSNHTRAVRNVDEDEAPNHLQTFNEGVTLAGEGADGTAKKKEAAGGGTSGSGSLADGSYGALPSSVATDAYGNRLGAMKSSFGDAAVAGGGGSGGGGGGGSSGAVGRGTDQTQALKRGGNTGGTLSAMNNAPQVGGKAGKKIALGAGAKSARGQMRSAAAMSQQARNSSGMQASGALAGKAFNGGTSGGGSRATVGGGAGISSGIKDGNTADPVKNPENNIKSPDVAPPKKVEKNESCKEENLKAMDPGSGGPMSKDEFATLNKTCDNAKKLKDLLIQMAVVGGMLVMLNMLGGLIQKADPKDPPGTRSKLLVGAMVMYGIIMLGAGKIILDAVKIMNESPSLKGEAIGVIIGSGIILAGAGMALYGAYQEHKKVGEFNDAYQKKEKDLHSGHGLNGDPPAKPLDNRKEIPDPKFKDAPETIKSPTYDQKTIKGPDGKDMKNPDYHRDIDNPDFGKKMPNKDYNPEYSKMEYADKVNNDIQAQSHASKDPPPFAKEMVDASNNRDAVAKTVRENNADFKKMVKNVGGDLGAHDSIRSEIDDVQDKGWLKDPGDRKLPDPTTSKGFESGNPNATLDKGALERAKALTVLDPKATVDVNDSTKNFSGGHYSDAEQKSFNGFMDRAKAENWDAQKIKDMAKVEFKNNPDLVKESNLTANRMKNLQDQGINAAPGHMAPPGQDPGFSRGDPRPESAPVPEKAPAVTEKPPIDAKPEGPTLKSALKGNVSPQEAGHQVAPPTDEAQKKAAEEAAQHLKDETARKAQEEAARRAQEEAAAKAAKGGGGGEERLLKPVPKAEDDGDALGKFREGVDGKVKDTAGKALTDAQKPETDPGGGHGSESSHTETSTTKTETAKAEANQQAANVAKASGKTGESIGKLAKGLGKEFGGDVTVPDGQAGPVVPGSPDAAAAAANPGQKIAEGPGSVEEEMKKLFG